MQERQLHLGTFQVGQEACVDVTLVNSSKDVQASLVSLVNWLLLAAQDLVWDLRSLVSASATAQTQ